MALNSPAWSDIGDHKTISAKAKKGEVGDDCEASFTPGEETLSLCDIVAFVEYSRTQVSTQVSTQGENTVLGVHRLGHRGEHSFGSTQWGISR